MRMDQCRRARTAAWRCPRRRRRLAQPPRRRSSHPPPGRLLQPVSVEAGQLLQASQGGARPGDGAAVWAWLVDLVGEDPLAVGAGHLPDAGNEAAKGAARLVALVAL